MNTQQRRRFVDWRWAARWRHALLFILVVVQSAIASAYMVQILPQHGATYLEIIIVPIFGVLFTWISVGFWTATAGFIALLFKLERLKITRLMSCAHPGGKPLPRTAILMPICNEDVARVFAGLQASYRSLQESGVLPYFEFFVLSDSNRPEVWIEEEMTWAKLCRELDAFDRIHYRRRRHNIKRKSGNIADFCRRWGLQYRYMIVMDADSVMSGATLSGLVEMMENRPRAGIIQTPPATVNQHSLFARVQQFANRVYGPMFTAGVHFWQLGDCYYWGHNAIIRTAPFIEHCALWRLPGREPFGGEILSHDFVEAALMRRGGWEVWLAYDLEGSYEESPPTLLDELKRDRRWCQGNLQHLRLLTARGLATAHRAMFVNGVMAYASALLWFTFLVLSTAEVAVQTLLPHQYFPNKPSLFPVWPQWHPDWALTLVASTAVLLFLPKFLSILLTVIKHRRARQFGGVVRLALSVVLETLISSLLAPIRMLFHSKFVFLTLLGKKVKWGRQTRGGAETSWRQALSYHGGATLLALAWAIGVYRMNPGFFWWLIPIIGALVLSIPLSVYSSRVSLGQWAYKHGMFLIPEEVSAPREIQWVNDTLRIEPHPAALPSFSDGFVRAVVEPYTNALHVALSPRKSDTTSARAARLAELREQALTRGPVSLGAHERADLLADAKSMAELHDAVWRLPQATAAEHWGLGRRVPIE